MHEGRSSFHTPDSVKSHLTLDDIWACVAGILGLTLRLFENCGFVDFQTLFLKAKTHLFILFILSRSSCFVLIASKTSV